MTSACRFGSFELQPEQRRLLEDGRPVELGHRAFDVLLALVERAGQLVTKDELLAQVWPGVVVEENNVQVQVSALRKILGTGAIATTAGRGYRFTLELVPGGAPSASPVTQRHNLPPQLTSFIGHGTNPSSRTAVTIGMSTVSFSNPPLNFNVRSTTVLTTISPPPRT